MKMKITYSSSPRDKHYFQHFGVFHPSLFSLLDFPFTKSELYCIFCLYFFNFTYCKHLYMIHTYPLKLDYFYQSK